ncbi:Ubiquitin carboxyl-terminal hydrolase 5 [Porphyridium purpureum]|uniref:Ubiquitin carboxyl-terminal hydrolase n=1 Tax=Porphyridium purpureum TaxID=35688 RepID=A0A5J4Z020_PORPP|nr:Ubiquitin carboxyl-terminal hydrolase 5 [Porphyridium purpureum]|eukprot:POR2712..scf208_2
MADANAETVLTEAVVHFVAENPAQLRTVPEPPLPTTASVPFECVFCFDTPLCETGLYTSLRSWRSYSADHLQHEKEKHGQRLFLLQKRTRVPKARKAESGPQQSSRGAGEAQSHNQDVLMLELSLEESYEEKKTLSLVILDSASSVDAHGIAAGALQIPFPTLDVHLNAQVDGILARLEESHSHMYASSAPSDWQEERKPTKYAEALIQLDAGERKISPDPASWACEKCGNKENLWLNLSDGFIGCGRRNWDGSGGCGAALVHYEGTGGLYPLAVKLGTITAKSADVYSYAPDEDDMVTDAALEAHLNHWGINMYVMTKTDKSMTELQLDLNKSFEFQRITEAGKDLAPVSGAGLIGLVNLGNSCYLNSVVQLLCCAVEIPEKYMIAAPIIFQNYTPPPETDFVLQFVKLVSAMWTDRYRLPGVSDADMDADGHDDVCGVCREPGQLLCCDGCPKTSHLMCVQPKMSALPEGDWFCDTCTAAGVSGTVVSKKQLARLNADVVRPHLFKRLVGLHNQFGTAEQQDALEFLQFFLEKVVRAEFTFQQREQMACIDGTEQLFTFELEDRFQCHQSSKVRYHTRKDNVLSLQIPLDKAVNDFPVAARKRPRGLTDSDGAAETEDNARPKVPFSACVEQFEMQETIADFYSSATKSKGLATKQTRFKSFPPYLLVHLRRYYVAEDWTAKKLDVSVEPPRTINLEHLRSGGGVQPGEELLPEESDGPAGACKAGVPTGAPSAALEPDPSIVAQLVSMGFSENGSKRAALSTKNADVETCTNWVIEHMDDPDFNDPPTVLTGSSAPASAVSVSEQHPAVSAEHVASLSDMGFTVAHASAALAHCQNNLERAADWLFNHADNLDDAVKEISSHVERPENAGVSGASSHAAGRAAVIDGAGKYELIGFLSHMGSNTSCGHYVAHLRRDGKWVLFNDEKVAVSENTPFDSGYIYMYRRTAP